jgi:NADH dehydrogenase
MPNGTTGPHRVVIVGGGFGGLYCAKELGNNSAVSVTLIDRRNFHLFQPLLYQVATGGLSPANIAAPLRSILRNKKNVRCVMAEVTGFDPAAKAVLTADGDRIPYDTLVLATGSTHHYFGHDHWETLAPGLKTIEDATEIRQRVLTAFEKAERSTDPKERQRLLTFVVVGGGPTGVEMAGSVAELAHVTMRRDFRAIDPITTRVVLIEGQNRVLSQFVEKLSARALDQLREMGVEVLLDCHVTDVQPDHVLYKPDGGKSDPQRIDTETVIWAAGVKASPLGKTLAAALGGAETDRLGRVTVGPDCTVPGHPDVYVVGDLANQKGADGKPLPGLAPVAMQQGKYVAGRIEARLRGGKDIGPFRYWDKGTMATIGRRKAVADAGWIKLSGRLAWLAWLFIHILYLARFENRVLVLFQWFFNYVTLNRAARLITGARSDPGHATRAESVTAPPTTAAPAGSTRTWN